MNSLQDDGSFEKIRARIREIQAEIYADPAAARRRDAEIDAERARFGRSPGTNAHKRGENTDKFSRTAMRRRPIDD